MSNFSSDDRRNWHHNVFSGLSVGTEETKLVSEYINANDFSANTVEAIRNDLRKFARWFIGANKEPLQFDRVAVRDIIDFRDHLRREKQQ